MSSRVTRGNGLLEGFLARKRAAMANSLIPETARTGSLLDIGCGSHPLFLLQASVRERWGVDKLLPPEGRTLDGVRLRRHDVVAEARLPFDEARFDVVTMLAVFEHIPAGPLRRLLADIRRVLRPGGTFVMTTPARWTDPILRAMARLGLTSGEEIDEHQDLYDRQRIHQHLADAGFPPSAIETGSFELGMNLWATATRPDPGP